MQDRVALAPEVTKAINRVIEYFEVTKAENFKSHLEKNNGKIPDDLRAYIEERVTYLFSSDPHRIPNTNASIEYTVAVAGALVFLKMDPAVNAMPIPKVPVTHQFLASNATAAKKPVENKDEPAYQPNMQARL